MMEADRGFAKAFERPRALAIDFDAVRAVALSSVIGASVALKPFGREHRGLCPFHREKTPSFYVNDEKGFYHCFGCGAHGDGIDFLVKSNGFGIREAAEMITGATYPVIQRGTPISEPEPGRSADAEALWTQAVSADWTVVAQYLANRALAGSVPPSLRYARLRYGSSGPFHPVMVAQIVNRAGDPQGVQRTYLTDQGRKLDVPKPKLSLGRVRGGSIRMAPATDEVALTEGAEDALSLQRMSGIPTWAAAGAGMMPSMSLPDSIHSVIIGADADEAGERSAQAAGKAFAEQGLRARIIRPQSPHKDFNAELMADGWRDK